MNENPFRGLHLGIERPALRQEHRKRAVWWLSASLIAVLVAYFLPVEQIQMRGDQLKGLVGGQGYGGSLPGWLTDPYHNGSQPATGDDPANGTFTSNGHHYTIEYIGTDTTAGHQVKADMSRPTVEIEHSTGTWYGYINSWNWIDMFDDLLSNETTDYWLDDAPNYASLPYHYGPISTLDSSGIPNLRAVDIELSTTSGGYTGGMSAVTNYPFFCYKVTCTDFYDSGVDQYSVGVSTAQGNGTYVYYAPAENISGTAHVSTTAASGATIAHDWAFTAGPAYGDPGAWIGFSSVYLEDGDPNLRRTVPHNQNVIMYPTGAGTAIGYLYMDAIPTCSFNFTGSTAAQVHVWAGWYILPWHITDPF